MLFRSPSNSLQKSSAIQKISVTLLSVIMIQYLLFDTSKLLNISDITKRIGSFFKLPIQLFYGVPYPELALLITTYTNDSMDGYKQKNILTQLFIHTYKYLSTFGYKAAYPSLSNSETTFLLRTCHRQDSRDVYLLIS